MHTGKCHAIKLYPTLKDYVICFLVQTCRHRSSCMYIKPLLYWPLGKKKKKVIILSLNNGSKTFYIFIFYFIALNKNNNIQHNTKEYMWYIMIWKFKKTNKNTYYNFGKKCAGGAGKKNKKHMGLLM